ncbi:putative glucan 1,3-beta-glucosidase [Neohortaea acidophila]|uniref:glucan endo-1,3-beta-D-glucosidase n=1 Tax=Neohortaea acidophila TaxID=245834 RepID=A0A6A6PSU0_9PEZI|nr:putative glucan 1,3-beta-glucosidase [Neohortaea acidophila]KAF2482751.1 putative glucan 1,3-beta-glucosidase [Neohortaea acidophila]
MNDTIKVWLGVWLENNATTNTRQLDQMYDILDQYPTSHFAGVIVGNEVLFRKDMTAAQLGEQLLIVKKNLAAKGITLPVSTSDIGSAWTKTIAADSDIVMGNVHPFFAGVKPNVAASWTWSFWQNNDVVVAGPAYGSYPRSLISETGWPSQGGNDCGTGVKCPTPTEGSIAGISEMNVFMDTWICPALANGTTYFWFEAFDEPWTTIFDDPTTGDYWEPHWGLMDVNRNIKEGLTIPDCGGQTVTKFW